MEINEAISEGMWTQSDPEFEACKVSAGVETEKREKRGKKKVCIASPFRLLSLTWCHLLSDVLELECPSRKKVSRLKISFSGESPSLEVRRKFKIIS